MQDFRSWRDADARAAYPGGEGALPLKYDLKLLGRFGLSGPDGPIELPNKKLAALLGYLACCAPEPQSREKLATLLWGSHFEAQARQNLRQALFRLRRVLGPDALIGDGDDISLAAAVVDCDVARLRALSSKGSREALAAAADLYQGPLLADVSIAEEACSDWLVSERLRLEGLALDIMTRHAEQALQAGDAESALRVATRAISVNALREDAHRLVIQALAAAGRNAEALKHDQDLVVVLGRELSTEPDAGTKSLVAELRSAQPIAKPGPTQSGDLEQRQLTIMVCSIGEGPLAAARDAEEMHGLIAAFQQRVADVVARFDGFVAQYQGNGVLVYFGYPTAQEHDGEQAVRAGLAIVEDVGTQASIGVATGLVVFDEKLARVAIGETPGLAARLQAVAGPGEIVIAASTRRLVGRMFDCRALDDGRERGPAQPVVAWRVLGEAAGVSRFEARCVGALSPLAGRQEEIDLLLRRWHQAKLGEGRVVLLSGEPGIGKSRIAESLLARLEGEPHARLRYFCSPHHAHSPLYPVIAQLERAVRFDPDSDAGAKLGELEALLESTSRNVPRDLALMADLLSVPTEGRYPALTLSPQQKREMTLTALIDQLDGLSAQDPVLIEPGAQGRNGGRAGCGAEDRTRQIPICDERSRGDHTCRGRALQKARRRADGSRPLSRRRAGSAGCAGWKDHDHGGWTFQLRARPEGRKAEGDMVASKERSAVVPDTPTAAESGIGDFVFVDWFGVMAPKALPAPVVEKLAKATAAAMQKPAIRERLVTSGVHPAGNSPEDFAERIARDYRIFGEVVKANDIRAN